jgi:type VI secretion system protein ImpG
VFSKHYQGELAFLRAAGKAYAEANPSTAGLLAERGSDPDVERLLEGFAFLAARIREHLDDSASEIIHDLAELLLPHFLRPLPACSIVEMLPLTGVLRARHRVAAGGEIASVPVDGTPCRFRTTADLDLLPVVVQDVVLDRSLGATPVLRVQLQASQQALGAVFHGDGLRLFLHGEFPLAATLLLWFARHLRGVRLKALPGGATVELPASSVRLPGLGPELPLLPWPTLAPPGYRALQEYFTLPHKFLFVDVRGLDQAKAAAAERFEIAFLFDRPPELPARVGKDVLRTNCVPVVNLFPTTADPVALRALGEEHLIRAADLPPTHMAIHSVKAVVGTPEGPGERVPYQPFFGFGHAAQGARQRYYRLRRTLSPIDDELDTWISVTRPLDVGGGTKPEVLSLEVMATNRLLPAQLKLGEISSSTNTSPTQATFRSIVAVSRPVRPPLGTELHWRIIAHLAANRVSLGNAEVLRGLLALYNVQGLTDQLAGRANTLRIEAVREARAAIARRLVLGAPVRGTLVELELDEAGFAGVGDAFLFGCAIDDLLAAQASLSSFAELAVRLQPTQREYTWSPRNGYRTLL